MQILKSLKNIKICQNLVMALGFYDGIHLGHTELISNAVSLAKKLSLKSAVFTFSSHPQNKLEKYPVQKMITDNIEKTELIKNLGVDYLIMVPFSKCISSLTPECFIKDILVGKLGISVICVGSDYRFGANALGNVNTLEQLSKKYNYKLNVTKKITYNNEDISSSYIRQLIQSGNIELANKMLGHNFSINQKVIEGKQIGRQLGIPTINQKIPENQLIPKLGVYATYVKMNNVLIPSVTNIGYRPTVDNKNTANIETHLINENINLYHKNIRVYYIKFIRIIRKFENKEKLATQIGIDIEKSIESFTKMKNNEKST